MADSSILLTDFILRDLPLRNRIVLAPMTRGRAGIERIPNLLMAEYYSQRSSAGLILSEATTIAASANGWNQSPGIYTDEMVEGWKQVASSVHDKGGAIFCQLWHCGRASHSSFLDGKLPVAPSAIKIAGEGVHTPDGKQPHEVPRALEIDEIKQIVADYAAEAKNAKDAGFDGIIAVKVGLGIKSHSLVFE